MAVAANIADDPRKYGLDTDEIQWMNGNGNPNWSPTPERVAELNAMGYYKATAPNLKSQESIDTWYANNGTTTPTETTPVTATNPAPTSYSSAPASQPYNVSTLAPAAPPPDLQPTSQETEQSDLITKLQALNDQYATKSAYQNEQNALYGVDAKQATKNSLLATQRQIINEGIQAQLAVQQGQGVTTAIDRRQRDEALRVNAINALSISSLIAAADGDLANAQLLADKAVKEKFDPIEAEITAKMNNLNLIRNDPKTTLQEQNRAQAQQALLDQQAQAVAQAKSDMSNILKIAADAAANGATATQLQQIQGAKTPQEALQIAASFGLNVQDEGGELLSPSEAKTLGVPYGTTKEQAYGTATTSNPYSSTTFIQSGTGAQVTGEQILKGNYPAGTFFVDSKTGEKLTQAQIKSASTASSAGTTTTLSGLESGKTFVSGNFQYTTQDYQDDKNQLLQSRNVGPEADGKWADPGLYLQLYNAWIAAGGLRSDFLQIYPPKDYINPANTWPEIIALGGGMKPKTTTSSSRSA